MLKALNHTPGSRPGGATLRPNATTGRILAYYMYRSYSRLLARATIIVLAEYWPPFAEALTGVRMCLQYILTHYDSIGQQVLFSKKPKLDSFQGLRQTRSGLYTDLLRLQLNVPMLHTFFQ